MVPYLFKPPKEPFKRGYDIPNKYPLYKVYMGLTIKDPIPRVPPFFPMIRSVKIAPLGDLHYLEVGLVYPVIYLSRHYRPVIDI